MGKIKELLRDYWLVGFIVMLSLMVAEIFGALTGWWSITNFEERIGAGDLLRGLILCIGGIGAAIGLDIAIKRQEKFSKQVQVQVDQGYNDRLGRGVELLAKEDMVMRCAGVQILKDLADNADDRQKLIIAKIIYDFFRYKASLKYENNKPCHRSEVDSIQDLQDALDTLINLHIDMQKKLRTNDKSQLDFSLLDFSYLSFRCGILQQIDFSYSCFVKTKFNLNEIRDTKLSGAIFKDVVFTEIKFKRVDFACYDEGDEIEFTRVKFDDVDFTGTKFLQVKFMDVTFKKVDLTNVTFWATPFLWGAFWAKNTIKIFSSTDLPYFLGTRIESTKFELNNDTDLNQYFELCYYREGQEPPRLDASRGSSRVYENKTHGVNVFVESSEDWSGQPVEERLAMERAQWNVDIKNEGFSYVNGDMLEMELAQAKATLHSVEKTLKADQAQKKSKSKSKTKRTPKPKKP